MNIYYVYIIYDELQIARYIGKGSGNRVKHHWKSYTKTNPLLRARINDEYTYTIYRDKMSERDAFDCERSLILKYGRVIDNNGGTLFNFTMGGEGLSGKTYGDADILKYGNRISFKLYDRKMENYTREFLSLGDGARCLKTSAQNIYSLLHGKTKTILKGRYSISNLPIEKFAANKIPISIYDLVGDHSLKFNSITEASRYLNVDKTQLCKLLKHTLSHIGRRYVLAENSHISLKEPTVGKYVRTTAQRDRMKKCVTICDTETNRVLNFDSNVQCETVLELNVGDVSSLRNGKIKLAKKRYRLIK